MFENVLLGDSELERSSSQCKQGFDSFWIEEEDALSVSRASTHSVAVSTSWTAV